VVVWQALLSASLLEHDPPDARRRNRQSEGETRQDCTKAWRPPCKNLQAESYTIRRHPYKA